MKKLLRFVLAGIGLIGVLLTVFALKYGDDE